MPLFQGNGGFDGDRYKGFLGSVTMTERGLVGTDLEDIVRESLRVKKIKAEVLRRRPRLLPMRRDSQRLSGTCIKSSMRRSFA